MGVSPKILMLNGALTSVSETIHKAHKARKFDLLARQPNPDMAANGAIPKYLSAFLASVLGYTRPIRHASGTSKMTRSGAPAV